MWMSKLDGENTQGSDPTQRTIGEWGKLGIGDMGSLPLSEKKQRSGLGEQGGVGGEWEEMKKRKL